MNRKYIRKRILPMILAAALVISDAGYGRLPVVYAEETKEQVQADNVNNGSLDTGEQELTEEEDDSAGEESVVALEAENEQNAATEEDTAETRETSLTNDETEPEEENLIKQESTVTEPDEAETEEKKAEEVQEVTASGSCGTNVQWSYDSSTKTLTISGSGDMSNFTASDMPWYRNKAEISNVVFAAGSSITKIGNCAFYGCTNLTTIEIPDSVTNIGSGAFAYCGKLGTINIPDKVASIGDQAFMESGLTQLELDHSVEIKNMAFRKCISLSSVTIKCDNIAVESYAFADCTGLLNVVINGNVTSIEDCAFAKCTELRTVKIPDGSPEIKGNTASSDYAGAFVGCSNLQTLEIPHGAGNIGAQAFKECTKLSSIKISKSATEIGQSAFVSSGLKTVEFEDGIDSLNIGESAFNGCANLTSVTIPKNTQVGANAFFHTGLTSVTVEDGANLNDGAFWQNESLGTVNLGKNVTIGIRSFQVCSNLKKVIIGAGSKIGESAFSDCGKLAEVTIEDGVSSIETKAFSNCIGLKSIELPESMETIKDGAFSRCTTLETVIIQGKGTYILGTPFSECSNKNFTLLVHKKSEAASYAADKNIAYKYIVEKAAFTSDSEVIEDLEEGAEAEITLQLLPLADDSAGEADSVSTVARKITWTVNDGAANVEIIDGPESGEDKVTATVKGVAEGTCTITANCDGIEATCSVKVVKRVLPVSFTPEGGLLIDQTVTLQCETAGATIYYTIDGTEPTKESLPYIRPITLENDAVIKAYATMDGYLPSKVTEMEYTVSKVTGIGFAEDKKEIDLGKTAELNVSLFPNDTAAQTPVKWVSGDPEIVSIEDDNGELGNTTVTIRANSVGECVIIASCEGKEAFCTIHVVRHVAPARAETEPAADSNGKLPVGAKIIFSTETEGADIHYLINDDSDIVFWGKPYKEPIVLDEPGTYIITVAVGITGDDWIVPPKQTFTFTVAEPSEEVDITGIMLDNTTLELGQEESRQLTVSFLPENATPKTVTWTSSDATVASVERSDATTAKITAKKAGTCTITATCGTYTATCRVTVTSQKRVAQVYTDPAAGEVAQGTKVALKCDTEGAKIYYTLDGSTPSEKSTLYREELSIDEAVTIKAIAVKEGYQNSADAEYRFTVKKEVVMTGIILNTTTLELGQEEVGQLIVSFLPEGVTPQNIAWSVDKPDIASVERSSNSATSAKIIGKKEGTCTVTATCGDFTAACQVTVTSEKRVSKVYTAPKAGEVKKGTTVTLKCDTEDAEIHYTLDGSTPSKTSTVYTKEIVVNEAVTIKAIAVKEGYQDSELAEYQFTVKSDVAMTGIALNVTKLELGQEEQRELTVSFLPEGAIAQSVTWSVDKPDIAGVERSGAASAKVTGKKAGTCIVTATCGTFTATCEVTVTDEKRVSKVYTVPGAGEVEKGTGVALKSDTEGAAIYYTLDGSTPSKTSTVYTKEIVVNEAVTIKAIAVKEGYQDSELVEYQFTVKADTGDIVITGISLNVQTLQLGLDEVGLLTVKILPENATPQKLIWTSDNPDIASVDENDSLSAKVTGKSAGTCTITAACGTFTATCRVTVTGERRVSQVYSIPEAGSVVTPGTAVSLYCRTVNAKIYYTLDGSVPTVRSTPYTKALLLNEDTVIRAIAVKEGYQDSAVAELDFTVNASIPDIPDIDPEKKGVWITAISDQPYTGSAIKPSFYVYDGNKLLQEKTDYAVSYKNNTKLGQGQIIITGKGNYADKKSITFKIIERPISDRDVIIEDMAYAFDGKLHKGAPVITHNGKKLKEGKDFDVDYDTGDYTSEGVYEVTIKGKGNYTGTAKGKIAIVGKDSLLSKAFISTIPEQKYNNGAEVTLKDEALQVRMGGKNGRLLQKDKDYIVSYANNINPGKATVIIKGINSYAGTKKAGFKIAYASAMMNEVQCTNYASFQNMDFIKGGCMPQPILVYNGYQLQIGTDYKLSYKNNKKVGTAKLVLSGKGRFKGTSEISFNIEKKNISDVAMRTLNVPYTGKANKYQSKPILTDTDGTILKEGTDYTLTYLYNHNELDKGANPPEHAVITVNVEGKGSYSGSRSDTYALEGTSFSGAKITVKNQEYTGKAVVLSKDDISSATIKVSGITSELKYGEDFEIVSYSKNIKKGTATVVFGGIGKYSGEKAVKFKIVNRNINTDK